VAVLTAVVVSGPSDIIGSTAAEIGGPTALEGIHTPRFSYWATVGGGLAVFPAAFGAAFAAIPEAGEDMPLQLSPSGLVLTVMQPLIRSPLAFPLPLFSELVRIRLLLPLLG